MDSPRLSKGPVWNAIDAGAVVDELEFINADTVGARSRICRVEKAYLRRFAAVQRFLGRLAVDSDAFDGRLAADISRVAADAAVVQPMVVVVLLAVAVACSVSIGRRPQRCLSVEES